MLTTALYSVAAICGALVAFGAIWVVARAIGAAQALGALSDLRTRLTELEQAFAFFADQYELAYVRNAAKLGKLRRKIEALQDGDDDDQDEPEEAAPALVRGAQAPTFASGSDVLKFARDNKMVR